MKIIKIFLIILSIIIILPLSLFIFLTLNCFYRYYKKKKTHHTKNILDKHINFLYDKKRQQDIIVLFKKLLPILKNNNLEWWMIGGSLLGVERHKGFIPWDDDLDIAITYKSLEKLKNINIEKYGLTLKSVTTYAGSYYQLYHLKDKDNPYVDKMSSIIGYSNNNNVNVTFIDIFPYNLINNIWIPTAFKDDTILNKDLFPLKKDFFHNIEVNVPNNYFPYLNRSYKDWDKKVKIYLPHNSGLIGPLFLINKKEITQELQELFYKHSENIKY